MTGTVEQADHARQWNQRGSHFRRGQGMGEIRSGAIQFLTSHPEIKETLKGFLNGFDVTIAKTHVSGRGTTHYFFLKPERFIQEYLGVSRELLLQFSPHKDFQARTLEIHETLLSEHQSRLDPAGSILISQANDVYDHVQDYLVRERERPPIVALSAEAAGQIKSANDVHDVFGQHFFKRDLFALESPLRGDLSFFGRELLLPELMDRFRSGQNSGLFGLRRIGKTSVLNALGRRIESARLGQFAYIDLSNPTLYQARWWDLLRHIIATIVQPLDFGRSQRNRIRALTVAFEPHSAAGHFAADIAGLLAMAPKNQLLLALDEIEYVTFDVSPSDHWQTDFLPMWQTMRSIHQQSRGRFSFVVAGVNPHPLEVPAVAGVDNPLFATTHSYFLAPFDRTEVRSMVRRLARYMGLRPEEDLYDALTTEYGGHPFLIRQACSHLAALIHERPGALTLKLFQHERDRIALALDKIAQQILNVLATRYPDEYELLVHLASGDAKTFVEWACDDPNFTQHVEGYGLVRNARTAPEITIDLVRVVLERSAKASWPQRPAGTDDLLAEISRRRNRVEKELRVLLAAGLQFEYGKKAMASLMQSLPEPRRDALMGLGYEDVWTKLYFSELANVLEKQWKAFQRRLEVDKAEILQWLHHINACRADAHASTLSEDDFAFLRVCFARLEGLLGLH